MTNSSGVKTPKNRRFSVIMAPTEGADAEKSALSVGIRLAKKHDSTLHLVRVEATPYVVEPIPRRRSTDNVNAPRDEGNVNKDELQLLAAACKAAAHIRVVASFEKGPVGRTLHEYAAKSGADLIVMASHSHGGKRVALGSVTEYLIRRTSVPVLVVKGAASFLGATSAETFTKIVIPLDGSALSQAIVPAAKKLALALNSEICLVHVLTPTSYSEEEIVDPVFPWWEAEVDAAKDYLDTVAADLAADGISVTTDVLMSDDITTAILDYSARKRADIIAIATSGRGRMSRLVFGSVAAEITHQSPFSLFALHPLGSDAGVQAVVQHAPLLEAGVS